MMGTKQKGKVSLFLISSCLIGILAWSIGVKNEGLLRAFPASAKNITESYEQQCPNSTYSVQVFSFDPLIVYLRDFISTAEREHLKHVALVLHRRV